MESVYSMKKTLLYDIEKVLLPIVTIMMTIVLFLSLISNSLLEKNRSDGSFEVVENISFHQIESVEAPTGVIYEYSFTLDRINHSDALAFYINHHYIEVYIGDTCVYHLVGNSDTFRTTGGVWAMIPLYKEDMGKTIRIELYPVYQDYQDKDVQFIVGSELAIYEDAFLEALPELTLSFCVILTGCFLILLAIYHTIKNYIVPRLFTVGCLSLSAGIWRLSYGRFIYLVLREQGILIYTISIISLMILALSMLNCVEFSEEKPKKYIRCATILYCMIYILQLGFQAFGIYDLRQTLKLIHLTLIMSAAILFINGLSLWLNKTLETGRLLRRNYSWILGIGVLVDLELYYFAETTSEMIITLGAILCFSLLEGIRLLMDFSEQRNTLEEMKNKLTLSRTTTMMSQIRSHFVFNILNAISGMCKYDPEKADDTVVRFARYLRNNIDIMENDRNIPFSVDLRQLEDYVVLEQIRFGDKIEFYTDIETDQFMIPPLILQPIVENAIKHGISKKLSNGTIIVRTRELEENIFIEVQDDGVGFDLNELEKEKSVGIRNIRFRLEYLVNGKLDIISQKEVGTTVTITIPKNGEAL